MKTRVQRIFCTNKSRYVLSVQIWRAEEKRTYPQYSGQPEWYVIKAHWETVRDFEENEYEAARQYALNASKPLPVSTLVEFSEGVQQ
jgi:hypothetical protein